MRGVWTPEEVREAEGRLFERVAEASVMRRAAWAVAVRSAELLVEAVGTCSGRHVVLLVGAGNNGGDALWAGAFLARRGVGVTAVLLAPERTHAAGLAALRRVRGRVVTADGEHRDTAGVSAEVTDALERGDLVIDGIVGLSGRGPLRPLAAEIVRRVDVPILAVDLPSGVDPWTGAVDGPAVAAHTTVTFGGLKPGHVLGEGARCSGEIEVVDIGLDLDDADAPIALLDDAEIGAAWPIPESGDDKYTQGVLGVAAGSATFPGAAVLTSGAAVATTSGMVRYAGPAAEDVRSRWPELVTTGSIRDAGRVQAWAIGPGIGTGSAGRDALRWVLEAGLPVCADADAVTLLAQDETLWDSRDPDAPLVLTPHVGEFERLVGPLGADRIAAAREFARRRDVVLLLKGHSTVIAAPDGRVLVNRSPGAWPATAGSGDVLTGMIGALLAAGLDPWFACGAAAATHSRAAERAAEGDVPDRGAAPIGASMLLTAVPEAIRELRALG